MTKQISFSDLDFSTMGGTRNRTNQSEFDGYLAVRRKGKARKSDSFDFNLSSFIHQRQKTQPDFKPEVVSVGVSRFKRDLEVYLVFDNKQVDNFKISYYKDSTICSFRAPVVKIVDALGLDAPTKQDTSMNLFFKLEGVPGQPNLFRLIGKKVIKKDAQGIITTKTLP